tara:strand:- start:6434 stop:7624 length:1191 start_codon:yes stop_codon:yes gene_type:complete
MKKVCFICTHPQQYTGYSKVVYKILKYIDTSEYEVSVYGFQRANEVPENYRNDLSEEIVVYDAAANEYPKAAGFNVSGINQFISLCRPEIIVIFNDAFVVSNFLNQIIQGNYYKMQKKVKIIVYFDQVYEYTISNYIENFNKYVDELWAFTKGWETCILKQGLKIPTKVVTHASSSYVISKQEACKNLNLKCDTTYLLNLNNNQPRKRFDIFMMSLAIFFASNPDADLKVLITKDTQTTGYNVIDILSRELINNGSDKSIDDIIMFIEQSHTLTDTEINWLYNASDFGINTCDGEGFGLCNFEQASVGKPQIVSKVGGFKEFFNEDNSILINPITSLYLDQKDSIGGKIEIIDPSEVAKAIELYYNNPELRKKHGTQSKDDLSVYSWETITKHLFD